MTSAVYIPMAKLLDIWGRAEGFLLMVGFATLGVILMATSNNLATFCAAQVSEHGPILCFRRSLVSMLTSRETIGILFGGIWRNHLRCL